MTTLEEYLEEEQHRKDLKRVEKLIRAVAKECGVSLVVAARALLDLKEGKKNE